MKYTITINQLSAIGGEFNLDIIDLAIFDFVRAFFQSGRCECEVIGKKVFFWVSPRLIISEMPILGITSTRGINLRIENLIREKLLERGPENKSKHRTYLAFGEKVCMYDFYNWNEETNTLGNFIPSQLGTDIPQDNNINNIKNNICAKTSSDGFSANESLFDGLPSSVDSEEADCHQKPKATSQTTTKNNDATIPRVKATIEERKEEFRQRCLKYVPKYGSGKVDRFVNVWTEHNEGGRLMRFEMCKTFNIAMRIAQFRDYGHENEAEAPHREEHLTLDEIEKVMNWRRND